MSTWATVCCIAVVCAVVLDVGRRYRSKTQPKSSHPLPPGPPGLPFFGNVIGINTSAPWLTYAEWAKTYGDLVYSRVLGTEIIIINSESIARDLLEKRSRNYSDRPYMATTDLCGMEFNTAILAYGDRWRLHRRLFHQTLRSDAVQRFLPYQHRQACQFLRRLLDNPDQLAHHVSRYTTLIILNSMYNYDALSGEDGLVGIVSKVLEIVVPAFRPDIPIIVGAFPTLLSLPSWLPGMSFKKKMEVAKDFSKQYLERPFEYSVQKMLRNDLTPSMVYDGLRKVEDSGNGNLAEKAWMDAVKDAAGTGFLAGAETSTSAIMTFFLMMVVKPKVQEKALAQIDAVVGGNRLPATDDRPFLPYIDAIIRELHRYNPLVPLSIPHAAVDDDVYAGFHIPKGAFLITNLWSMAHKESKFPNPHEFIPERFLNDDGSLKPYTTENLAFGFGRRICVGRHFADTSLWSVIVKFLAVFKILKAVDENGVEIPVEPKFTSSLVVHPIPFRFRIVPRKPGMDCEKLEDLIAASTV